VISRILRVCLVVMCSRASAAEPDGWPGFSSRWATTSKGVWRGRVSPPPNESEPLAARPFACSFANLAEIHTRLPAKPQAARNVPLNGAEAAERPNVFKFDACAGR